MKIENTQELKRLFPNLYKIALNQELKVACGYWDIQTIGATCGDGWYSLVINLSEKIENEILKLPEEKRSNYYATQVKEKLGSLRFYMSNTTKEMQKLIQKAERESSEICEICGKPSKIISTGSWLYNRCKDCSENLYERSKRN